MEFSEKLIKNWECGLYSLVENNTSEYRLFSTMYSDTHFRHSSVWSVEKNAINYAGHYDISLSVIDSNAKLHGWKIVRTIHPSELMGKGFVEGQKIAFRKDIEKIFEKHGRNMYSSDKNIVKDGYGYFEKYLLGECEIYNKDKFVSKVFPIEAIRPFSEESDTVEITVEGKTKTISRM